MRGQTRDREGRAYDRMMRMSGLLLLTMGVHAFVVPRRIYVGVVLPSSGRRPHVGLWADSSDEDKPTAPERELSPLEQVRFSTLSEKFKIPFQYRIMWWFCYQALLIDQPTGRFVNDGWLNEKDITDGELTTSSQHFESFSKIELSTFADNFFAIDE